MSVEEFFDIQEFAASKTPKEKRRFTYWDMIKFAELYHIEESKRLLCAFENELACKIGYAYEVETWTRRGIREEFVERELLNKNK